MIEWISENSRSTTETVALCAGVGFGNGTLRRDKTSQDAGSYVRERRVTLNDLQQLCPVSLFETLKPNHLQNLRHLQTSRKHETLIRSKKP